MDGPHARRLAIVPATGRGRAMSEGAVEAGRNPVFLRFRRKPDPEC